MDIDIVFYGEFPGYAGDLRRRRFPGIAVKSFPGTGLEENPVATRASTVHEGNPREDKLPQFTLLYAVVNYATIFSEAKIVELTDTVLYQVTPQLDVVKVTIGDPIPPILEGRSGKGPKGKEADPYLLVCQFRDPEENISLGLPESDLKMGADLEGTKHFAGMCQRL
jgi:hypothetical protein